MKKYKVVLQSEAVANLNAIAMYVSQVLKSPLAAINLEIQLTEAVLSLEYHPQRAPFFSDKFKLSSQEEVRKLIVDNYIILFYIDESSEVVHIVSVYSGLQERKN